MTIKILSTCLLFSGLIALPAPAYALRGECEDPEFDVLNPDRCEDHGLEDKLKASGESEPFPEVATNAEKDKDKKEKAKDKKKESAEGNTARLQHRHRIWAKTLHEVCGGDDSEQKVGQTVRAIGKARKAYDESDDLDAFHSERRALKVSMCGDDEEALEEFRDKMRLIRKARLQKRCEKVPDSSACDRLKDVKANIKKNKKAEDSGGMQ